MARKNTTASKPASKAAAKSAPKEKAVAELREEMIFHKAKVTGGRKLVGDTVRIENIINGRYGSGPTAVCFVKKGGQPYFIAVSNLELGEELDDAATLRAEREAFMAETILVNAHIIEDRDTSVKLIWPELAKALFVAKQANGEAAFVRHTDPDEDDRAICEVPLWMIASKVGTAEIDRLKAEQPVFMKAAGLK